MPKIAVNGVQLHYWQAGQGPEVVMIHGLGGNLAGWHLNMVPELRNHFRLTTYDLRGHGRSKAPPEPHTTRCMAVDLRGLMDGLGIERAHLVAHSWGVDVALHFALLCPERVVDLVLIEGALLSTLADTYRRSDWEGWPYILKTLESLSGAPIPEEKRGDLRYLLNQLMSIPVMYGPAKGRARDEEVIARVIGVLQPMWATSWREKELTVEALGRISHRALVLYESSSVFLRAFEVLQQRLPNPTPMLLPGGRLKHFTGLEHPELILKHTRAFLNGRQAPGLSLDGESGT